MHVCLELAMEDASRVGSQQSGSDVQSGLLVLSNVEPIGNNICVVNYVGKINSSSYTKRNCEYKFVLKSHIKKVKSGDSDERLTPSVL